MAARVRLNFVISNEADRQLGLYCQQLGRSQTDVIRQLVIEWLEGDRALPEPCRDHPDGRRTNIQLTTPSREALEARVAREGHITLSAAIDTLLRRFLAARTLQSTDLMTVRLKIPLGTYDKAAAAAKLRGESVEQFIHSTLEARLENMVSALQGEV